jgi:DNA-3-methyladenine glycosylase II
VSAASRYFTIEPSGSFDLAQSIGFLEDWPVTRRPADDSVLRFAFCVEHDWRPVGIRVSQHGHRVDVETTGPGVSAERIRPQIARVLSLDVDASGLDDLARHDPVVARLIRAAPGLRPVCFWTPWEAACWAILSQRTPMRAASALKQRIAGELGTPVEVDGTVQLAFPSPQAVLEAPGLPGVSSVKLDRIRALAGAAKDGTLTAGTLRAIPADDALAALRRLPGIGPFSAALILIRGAGAPDVFTTDEPRLLAAMRRFYQLPDSATADDYRTVAEGWRPLRSWVSFWMRSISPSS